MKFGKVISSFRQKFDIDQQTLADGTGISVNYLSLLENDKRKPSSSVLNAIAKYFGIPVSSLIYNALLNSGVTPRKEDKKIFEAAQPIIDLLLSYLVDLKTTERKKPRSKRKSVQKSRQRSSKK